MTQFLGARRLQAKKRILVQLSGGGGPGESRKGIKHVVGGSKCSDPENNRINGQVRQKKNALRRKR